MFAQEPPTQDQKPFTLSQAVSLIYLGCHIWSLPLELVLRRRFGSRYIDGYLVLAAVWPMIFAAMLVPEYPVEWTWWALWLILIFGVYNRLAAVRLDHLGFIRHSQYSGYPILCRFFKVPEETCKTRWEVLLVMFLSLWTAVISPSLTLYLFGGCLAGAIKQGLQQFYQENELVDLRDARLEQESLAQRFNAHQIVFSKE